MPWKVIKKDDSHCVYKLGADGSPTGEAIHCHATHEEAVAQMRSLHASESKSIKFADINETEIEGYLAPYGGPFNGKDITGEFFSAKTNFALDWFPDNSRPLLFHHGLDAKAGIGVVGRIKSLSQDDIGLWMQAQLDASSEYYGAIKELIKKGKLGLSSGSMRHLVDINIKSGEILRWPVIEGSLTPTPANPIADVDFATVKAHYDSIGSELPTEDELAAKITPAHKMASWEEIRRQCQNKLTEKMSSADPFGSAPNAYVYIEDTYSGHVVACVSKNGEEKYFSVPFTLDESGNVGDMGTAQEVEEIYVPVKPSMDSMPMSVHADMAKSYATSLLTRTKDLQERRTKEGRELSSANREHLAGWLSEMDGACNEIRSLIAVHVEEPAKAGVTTQLQIELLKIYAATL